MFKKRSIQLKFVKDNDSVETETEKAFAMEPEEIARMTREGFREVAVAGLVYLTATFVLYTASQVIINACDTDKEKDD